uniref:AKTx n=1 Tax=Hadrurus spadix TaxID=141984 RepID=A0A1W7RB18_9SCOR
MRFIIIATFIQFMLFLSQGSAEAQSEIGDGCSRTGICMKNCNDDIRQPKNDVYCNGGLVCCTLLKYNLA